MLVMIILLRRGRKRSRQPSYPHQHICDETQHGHTGYNALSQSEVDSSSRLEVANALYTPPNVKYFEQHSHDRSRSDVIGCNIIITPNPSYIASPNSLQNGKESEHQYDYIETDELVQHDKVLEPTSAAMHNETIHLADNINIDHNPYYKILN